MNALQKKIAQNYGLMAGFFFALYYFGAYIFNPDLFIGYLKSVLFFVTVGFLLIAALEYRKAEDSASGKERGFASFRALLGVSIMIILITSAVATLSSIVVFQALDPELGERLTEVGVQKAVEMQRSLGVDDEQIDEYLSEVEGSNLFSLRAHGITFLIWFLVYTLVAALIALILKRKSAVEAPL